MKSVEKKQPIIFKPTEKTPVEKQQQKTTMKSAEKRQPAVSKPQEKTPVQKQQQQQQKTTTTAEKKQPAVSKPTEKTPVEKQQQKTTTTAEKKQPVVSKPTDKTAIQKQEKEKAVEDQQLAVSKSKETIPVQQQHQQDSKAKSIKKKQPADFKPNEKSPLQHQQKAKSVLNQQPAVSNLKNMKPGQQREVKPAQKQKPASKLQEKKPTQKQQKAKPVQNQQPAATTPKEKTPVQKPVDPKPQEKRQKQQSAGSKPKENSSEQKQQQRTSSQGEKVKSVQKEQPQKQQGTVESVQVQLQPPQHQGKTRPVHGQEPQGEMKIPQGQHSVKPVSVQGQVVPPTQQDLAQQSQLHQHNTRRKKKDSLSVQRQKPQEKDDTKKASQEQAVKKQDKKPGQIQKKSPPNMKQDKEEAKEKIEPVQERKKSSPKYQAKVVSEGEQLPQQQKKRVDDKKLQKKPKEDKEKLPNQRESLPQQRDTEDASVSLQKLQDQPQHHTRQQKRKQKDSERTPKKPQQQKGDKTLRPKQKDGKEENQQLPSKDTQREQEKVAPKTTDSIAKVGEKNINRGGNENGVIVHGLRKKPEASTLGSTQSGEGQDGIESQSEAEMNVSTIGDKRGSRKRKVNSVYTPSQFYAMHLSSATAKAVRKLRKTTLNVTHRQYSESRTKRNRRKSKLFTVSTAGKETFHAHFACNPMITNPESALLIDLNFEDDTSQAKSPPKKKTRSRQSSPSSSESSTPEQGHTTASKTAKQDKTSSTSSSVVDSSTSKKSQSTTTTRNSKKQNKGPVTSKTQPVSEIASAKERSSLPSASSHSEKQKQASISPQLKKEGQTPSALASQQTLVSANKKRKSASSSSIAGLASSQSSKKQQQNLVVVQNRRSSKSSVSIVGSASSQSSKKQVPSTSYVKSTCAPAAEKKIATPTVPSDDTPSSQLAEGKIQNSLLSTSQSSSIPEIVTKKRASASIMGSASFQSSKKQKQTSSASTSQSVSETRGAPSSSLVVGSALQSALMPETKKVLGSVPQLESTSAPVAEMKEDSVTCVPTETSTFSQPSNAKEKAIPKKSTLQQFVGQVLSFMNPKSSSNTEADAEDVPNIDLQMTGVKPIDSSQITSEIIQDEVQNMSSSRDGNPSISDSSKTTKVGNATLMSQQSNSLLSTTNHSDSAKISEAPVCGLRSSDVEPKTSDSSKTASNSQQSAMLTPASNPSDISLHFTQWQNKARNLSSQGLSQPQRISLENVDAGSSRSSSPKPSQSDSSVSSNSRRRSRRNRLEDADSSQVPVGQVGFKFEKFFPGHGLFKGEVVDVRGPLRRCHYTDGDQEDLTLAQMKSLVKAEKKRNLPPKSPEKKDTRQGKVETVPKQAKVDTLLKQAKIGIFSSSNSEQSDYENDFAKADQIMPLDEAAAMTLHERTKNDSGVKNRRCEVGDAQWLKDVATLLKTTDKGSKKKNKKIFIGDGCNDAENMDINWNGNEIRYLMPSEITRAAPLLQVKKGFRHGCKVFNLNDEKRIVGQVLVEHNSNWVEVVINTETKKDRVSNYIAVPANYVVGKGCDVKIVKKEIVNRPLTPTKQDKTRPSSSEVKINVESVFYWYCKTCKIPNSFLQQVCTKCDAMRHCCTSAPSPLLEIAENVSIVHDNEDAIQAIPHLYRRSIPKDMLAIIQQSRKVIIDGGDTKVILPMPAPLNADSLFYWRCSLCTTDNSYKRWSCASCRKKKTGARQSILLEIAYGAAKDALTVDDAMEKVPDFHKCAIPAGVMRSLVTCIAVVPKTNRRCQNPKLHNSDYCSSHRTAIANLSESSQPKSHTDDLEPNLGNKKDESEETRAETFIPIDRLVQNLRTRLRETRSHLENARGWEIQCIEDAFLCERNEPFPLGLKVRRYFPGFGYHDGEITDAKREQVVDPDEENARPVLVYRIKYNDGDEEDLLHHEVNSLRQIYDIRSVRPTAPTSEQIHSGTKFETHIGNAIVEVLHVGVNQSDLNDRGTVYARVEKPNETVKDIEIELTKLQLTVVRRLTPHHGPRRKPIAHWLFSDGAPTNQPSKKSGGKRPPFLEWPPPPLLNQNTESHANENEESICLSFPGLTLHSTSFHEYPAETSYPDLVIDRYGRNKTSCVVEENTCHTRNGVPKYGHDPAGAYRYLTYNPYEATKCEICKSGKDGHHLLICDHCDKGYHTYCLRPVVVNIPRDEWSCRGCSSVRPAEVTFGSVMEELKANPKDVMTFLGLPLDSTDDFCRNHEAVFEILGNRKQWTKKFSKKRIIETVSGIAISRNKDKQLLILPEPMQDPDKMMHSLTSIVASCKYCGMDTYSESLAYEKRLTESSNDASLDTDVVTSLSKLNLQLFQHYKENLRNGVFPPVEVVYDGNIGFLVKSLAPMRKHTILTEYVGEVTTIDQTGNTSSDSLMNLLQTGDDSTSLTIDPSKIGNIARFFSGINNRNLMSKKKANVRTRRFKLDGKCKVVLFTSRDVDAGEILHYDYNAGIEGKSVGEIVRSGFYDTSNFL